jgi:LysM repeat protein
MLRMVVVILLAVSGWFGYQHLFGSSAAQGGERSGGAGLGSNGLPTVADATPPPGTAAGDGNVLIPPDDSVAVALRQRSSPGEQGGVANAASRGSVTRSDPEASLADLFVKLGSNNAFLHSDSQRAVVDQILKLSEKESDDAAVITLTNLLELAMRGPVRKEDHDAKACVDRIFASLQRPLRNTVLNPAATAGCRSHRVQPGDSLERIASIFRKQGFQVESGTLAMLNRITDPRRIQVGQVVKIPVAPVRTVIEKNSFLMAVYVGDAIVRLYWIGHGKDGCTPEATFEVAEKQERPDWYVEGRVIPYGHPDNLLGAYFVKFKHESFTGFGAHGTPDKASIGTMASSGCIRLGDGDIEDYFRIVPRGTKVEIRASK